MIQRKGQAVFLSLMLGIVILVLALAFAPALRQFTSEARAPTTTTSVGLDCSNSSISDFDKSTCVLVDLNLPYFILGVIGIAFIVILAKIAFGGSA